MFSLNNALLFDRLDEPQLVAVVEKGRLVDLWTVDNSTSSLGSVQLARVTGRFDQHNRLTGQLACGRNVSWLAKGTFKPKEGQLVMVTVTAAARENKPLQAVAGVELAGQYVVLRWLGEDSGQIQFSRKLRPSAQLEQQCKKIRESCNRAGLLNAGFTLIIRRSAFPLDGTVSTALCKALVAEITQMIKHWQSFANMPKDFRLETKARAVYAGQSLKEKLNYYHGDRAFGLLSDRDWQVLCEELERADQAKIITKDAAVIYVEQTRAAVMIDIDSAASKLPPYSLSTSILPELFAVIRLRRLAGKIFVDMPALTKTQRLDILQQADKLARLDIRHPICLGFTRSGMLELSVRHGRVVLDKDESVQEIMASHSG